MKEFKRLQIGLSLKDRRKKRKIKMRGMKKEKKEDVTKEDDAMNIDMDSLRINNPFIKK